MVTDHMMVSFAYVDESDSCQEELLKWLRSLYQKDVVENLLELLLDVAERKVIVLSEQVQ